MSAEHYTQYRHRGSARHAHASHPPLRAQCARGHVEAALSHPFSVDVGTRGTRSLGHTRPARCARTLPRVLTAYRHGNGSPDRSTDSASATCTIARAISQCTCGVIVCKCRIHPAWERKWLWQQGPAASLCVMDTSADPSLARAVYLQTTGAKERNSAAA